LLGQKPIVLYFYLKDDAPGCTAESCAFRDSYEIFEEAGAEVIGISADTPTLHQQFAAKYRLPFIRFSDMDNRARRLYGVPAILGRTSRSRNLRHRPTGICPAHL
jgi:thioredoxin-dependent peroxiredoxin